MYNTLMRLFFKSTTLLILIILLATFLRLYQLGSLPAGISNDESGTIYSAYSIAKTGRDVAGKFLPISINLDNSFSPVNVYMVVPFVGLLGVSPFSGRLPSALISIGSVLLMYFLTKEILKDKHIALFATLMFAISPWQLQLGRTVIDANFALFFFLLGIFLFVYFIQRHSTKFLLSLPVLLIAFYSYHATKIFFVFLIPFLLVYYHKQLLQKKRDLGIFLVGSLAIVLSFLYISKTQDVTRQSVLLFNDATSATLVVNHDRTYNNAPKLIKDLYTNKFMYFGRILTQNYLEAFGPQYLFLYGEPSTLNVQYGTLIHGALYLFELPFFLLGIYYLAKNKKNRLALYLLLLAPLPSALSVDKSYVSRSMMMLPFLEIIVGCGIYFAWEKLAQYKKPKRNLLTVAIIIACLFFISEYFYTYYFRYPFYGSEAWKESSKEVAQFVGTHQQYYNKIYFDDTEPMFLFQYAIANRIDPQTIHAVWTKQTDHIGKIYFVTLCNPKVKPHIADAYHEKLILVVTPDRCRYVDDPKLVIRDKGEVFNIRWRLYEQ